MLLAFSLVLTQSLVGHWELHQSGDVIPGEFRSDGTFSATASMGTIAGHYKSEGGKFTFNVDKAEVKDAPPEIAKAVSTWIQSEYGHVSGKLVWVNEHEFYIDDPVYKLRFVKPGYRSSIDLARKSKSLDFRVGAATVVNPEKSWSTTAKGWSTDKLAEVKKVADEIGTTALMVVDDGQVAFHYGDVTLPHNLRSVRKPLVAGLIGSLSGDKKLGLNDTLAALKIDDLGGLTDLEKSATLEQILEARSGIYRPAAYEDTASTVTKPPRGSAKPGEKYLYNNWDFNVAGTIAARAAGKDLFDAFEERIAKPIGMQDFDRSLMRYERIRSSEHPAYLMYISARDLARYGVLFLRDGVWSGKRILPEGWVANSTRTHSPNINRGLGYGLFWFTVPPDSGPEGYFASGTGGQYLYVIPSKKLVIAHLVENERLNEREKEGKSVNFGKFSRLVTAIIDAKSN